MEWGEGDGWVNSSAYVIYKVDRENKVPSSLVPYKHVSGISEKVPCIYWKTPVTKGTFAMIPFERVFTEYRSRIPHRLLVAMRGRVIVGHSIRIITSKVGRVLGSRIFLGIYQLRPSERRTEEPEGIPMYQRNRCNASVVRVRYSHLTWKFILWLPYPVRMKELTYKGNEAVPHSNHIREKYIVRLRTISPPWIHFVP